MREICLIPEGSRVILGIHAWCGIQSTWLEQTTTRLGHNFGKV